MSGKGGGRGAAGGGAAGGGGACLQAGGERRVADADAEAGLQAGEQLDHRGAERERLRAPRRELERDEQRQREH